MTVNTPFSRHHRRSKVIGLTLHFLKTSLAITIPVIEIVISSINWLHTMKHSLPGYRAILLFYVIVDIPTVF